ncbi:cupin domain-containing protein [Kiloniella antarctica]|uniref:Cupin domain-containing protein n=1 Tax=Kiloniella antarctica TaxID=1550907 RepID=A0ABW5BKH2_9PROT
MTLTSEEILRGHGNHKIGTELVHTTDDIQIWHLRLEPGESIAPHRHDRPYFWTVLSDGTGQSRFDDGRNIPIIYRAGDTQHFPDLTPENGFVHDLTNTGDSPLVFVTVEFKTNTYAPTHRIQKTKGTKL